MSSNKNILCKVCFDAGKSPEVYSSHYVKSADRKRIICPTILSIKCRYCEKEGHTVKYCDALKTFKNRDLQQKQFSEREREREKEDKISKKKKVDTTVKNKFSILDDEEEEEEEEEKLPSYADVLNSKKEKEKDPAEALPIPKLVRSTIATVPKRWADYSDSESDSETESDIEQELGF